MNNTMTKQQLKETLREMRVSYPISASQDDLLQILQQENHRRWIQQAQRNGTPDRPVVRRRRGARP